MMPPRRVHSDAAITGPRGGQAFEIGLAADEKDEGALQAKREQKPGISQAREGVVGAAKHAGRFGGTVRGETFGEAGQVGRQCGIEESGGLQRNPLGGHLEEGSGAGARECAD